MPVKAFLLRPKPAWRLTTAALTLGIGLTNFSLALPAVSQGLEAGGFWTLTVVDEQGQAVPGAVLLEAQLLSTPSSAPSSADPAAAPSASSRQNTTRAASTTMSPLIIDQRNKRFEPFVTVSAPQRPVSFPNSDDIRHHVYSFSEGNAFERKLYRADDAEPVTFTAQGVVALGCNIHDNMQAYVLVTADSVAGPSDARGVIRVAGSAPPADTVTLPLWHPLLNTTGEASSVPLTRADGGATVTLPLTWNDPQERRSRGDLESLLREFSRENP